MTSTGISVRDAGDEEKFLFVAVVVVAGVVVVIY